MSMKTLFSRSTRSGRIPDSPHAGEVLTRHAEELMRLRGVMSVSLGRTEDGEPAIVIGLENPLAVPVNIPKDVEGVPVVHQDVGRVEMPEV